MAGQHAIFSPSGFKALMLCPAKPAMERGLPDQSSDYADEGTAAHFLGSYCLSQGTDAVDLAYFGRRVQVGYRAEDDFDGACWDDDTIAATLMAVRGYFTVDEEMAEAVQIYIDLVRSYLADGGELFVEQALPIGHITGEEGAEGTGDTVILRGDEIIVIDLKYGKGVEVSAIDNPQLRLYGLGALRKFDLVGDVEKVHMVISQPRIRPEPSEEVIDAQVLVDWAKEVATPAAIEARHIYDSESTFALMQGTAPHPDACRFCKAKGTCPALSTSVEGALQAEFTDLTTADATTQEEIVKQLVAQVPADRLGAKMDAVELVEMWCKAIRGRVEGELLAGRLVAGYKLVPGRKGARAWADADEAEKLLKSMRLKKEVMYELKLVSPTTAEKVLKATPKRWKKVLPLINQGEGKPSVAPVSDPRAAIAIAPVESEFSVIGEGAEDLV